MNKRIDLTNLGGFPMTQFTLSEMQDSYRGAFAAIAELVGSKTILYGVEDDGVNVSDGWIAYDGELIPFVGGPSNVKVVITETPVSRTFEDTAVYDVYFTKSATVALVGDFDFADLVTLLPLANIWLPGDLKQKYVDDAYIAANFDGSGYGTNKEKGWRILSSVVAGAAGKVFVNRDTGDADFDEAGNVGGTKEETLDITQIPAHTHPAVTREPNTGGSAIAIGSAGATSASATGSAGGGLAHNNMPPYFVVLTLIKL